MVFSPTLKMYLAESNVITTVGSVSEDAVLRTDALQGIEKTTDERWKGRGGIRRRGSILHGLRRHSKLASLTRPSFDEG